MALIADDILITMISSLVELGDHDLNILISESLPVFLVLSLYMAFQFLGIFTVL